MMRWAGRIGLGLLTLIVFAIGSGWLFLLTGLPQTSGTLSLPGLTADATVTRDKYGIPHIEAQSRRDAHFALGFVHAQDRFWQMDFLRRLGSGRLSEVIGAPTRNTDRMMRSLGIARLAQASLERLDPDARTLVDAYTDGVNAWLKTQSGAWPAEFYLLRYSPEPWRAADCLIWGRLMAMLLSRSWGEELLRDKIKNALGPEALDILLPPYPADAPRTLAALGIENPLAESSASNGWVLGPGKTESGKPILANDPHLRLRSPAVWYLARLSFPGGELTGATVPGVPFLVLGHNGKIVWGFTTAESDTQDLYYERTDTRLPGKYLTPDGWKDFETRRETLTVRGTEDETIEIRHTRHGPVISDLSEELAIHAGVGHVLALASPALREDDDTANALFALNNARSWHDFEQAMKRWHSPQQNIFYADTGGDFGMISAARMPLRGKSDGRIPAEGWKRENDWRGFLPFDRLPWSYNPARGVIHNANNPTGKSATQFRTPGYRARRLQNVMENSPPPRMEGSSRLQMDIVSETARDLLPLMLRSEFSSPQTKRAAALLKSWDFRMDRNRPEPMIFANWLRQLTRHIFADELGDLMPEWFGLRPLPVRAALTDHSDWCDSRKTAAVESCEQILQKSLEDALAQLASRFGTDIESWRWGDVHIARFNHPVLGRLPVLKSIGNVSLPVDGGNDTLNRGATRTSSNRDPFSSVHGAGYRAVYDLADLGQSRFIIAPGQSGHILSENYRSLTTLWRQGGHVRLGDPPPDGDVLRLTPE